MAEDKIIIPDGLKNNEEKINTTKSVRASSNFTPVCPDFCEYCENPCQWEEYPCGWSELPCDACEAGICQETCQAVCQIGCESCECSDQGGETPTYDIGCSWTYNSNGGSPTPSGGRIRNTQSTTPTGTYTITITRTVPTKGDYIFNGWYFQGNLYTSGDTVSLTMTTSVPTYTFQAYWTSPPAPTTFSCTITATSSTSVSVTASFQNGSQTNHRRFIRVVIGGQTVDIDAIEQGGTDNTFSGTISGLTGGTTYSWQCTLGYRGGGGDDDKHLSSYTDSGSVTTPSSKGVFIYATKTVNGVATPSWWPATPYIYTGSGGTNGWHEATPSIYTSSGWK